jgi:protein-tyrosine-phosphatase
MAAPFPRAVLFACNMNTIRSPMAAALLMRRTSGRISAESCGVWAGEAADPFMIEVMRELDIDLSGHRPRTFEELGEARFEVIVALTEESLARARELARLWDAEVEHWPVSEPALDGEETRASRLAAYREVRNRVDGLVQRRLQDRSTSGA